MGKKEKKWFVVILIDLIVIKKENYIEDKLIIKCFFECKYGSDLFNNRD